MKTPYKTVIVYDMETGGLKSHISPITQIAMIAIDMESMTVKDKMSVTLKPRIDLDRLSLNDENLARMLFDSNAIKDPTTGIKSITINGKAITLGETDTIVPNIVKLRDLKKKVAVLGYPIINALAKKDFGNLIIDTFYTPGAMKVTKLNLEMLESDGISYEDAFKQVQAFLKTHRTGNTRPAVCGHNIKHFDNKFMGQFFRDFKEDFSDYINALVMDTIEMARLKYFEATSYSLGACCEREGITLVDAHGALADTEANAKLFIKYINGMRNGGSGQEGKEGGYKRKKYTISI